MPQNDQKKLLVVSGSGNDVTFVNAAREMGVYVVCCDGNTDWNRSPAKKIADEAWDVDYSDTEAVARKCRENGIDGVVAGYSEHRVLAASRISKAIGTPYYATEQQVNYTRDKIWFKAACARHGIRVPKDYCVSLPLSQEERDSIEYPVIIKPADSAGRKGISVCRRTEDLDAAVEYAKSQSLNGDVVIEEYITGTELSAVYTLSNGNISLSCLNDKYLSEDESGATLCNLVMTPSCYYEQYMETVHPRIQSLMRELGATDGVANFQMIVGSKGITAFEMGFRVNGNDDYKVIRKYNGLDYSKMLVNHSLTGDMGDDLSRDNPKFEKLNCTLVLHLHKGTIQTFDYSGLELGNGIDDISALKAVGSRIADNGTNLGKAMMVKMSAKTLDEIIGMIHRVHATVKILDAEGNDMQLKRFNTDRLLNLGY